MTITILILEVRGLMHREIKKFVQGYTVNDEAGSVTKLYGLKHLPLNQRFSNAFLKMFFIKRIHKGDYNSPWEEFKWRIVFLAVFNVKSWI